MGGVLTLSGTSTNLVPPGLFDSPEARMSALNLNPALVVPGPRNNLMRGTAGETITAGQPIYQGTDNKLKLAGSKLPTPGYRVCGLAACSATAGQPIFYNSSDPDLILGLPLDAGQTLALGDVPGTIVNVEDVPSGAVVVVLGTAKTDSLFNLNITNSGSPKP